VPRVRDAVAGSFAGTALRYPHERGLDRLVGTRATEIPLRQGKLTHLQRSAGFVLIRERETAPMSASGLVDAERSDVGPAVLVRPDGYIAWAGNSSDREGWMTALREWLGAGLDSRPRVVESTPR
jgi:hypothetical protein